MSQTIRVSLPGYDALTDGTIDHYSVYADSDNILIKERSRGTTGITNGNRGTITHNSGYIPFFLTYGEVSTGKFRVISGFDPIGSGWSSYTGTSNLIIRNGSGGGTIVHYYIFYDDLP